MRLCRQVKIQRDLVEKKSVSWFEVRRDPPLLRIAKWAVAIVTALGLNWAYINGLPVSHGVEMLQATEPAEDDTFMLEMVDELPEMQYVETNPDAVENEPDETPNISNRNQQAAQEDLAGPERNDNPFLEGEDEESAKIVEGAMPVDGEDSPRVESVPMDSSSQPQPEQAAQQPVAPTPPQRSASEQSVEQQASPDSLPSIEAPSILDELPAIPPPPPTPDFIDEVEPEDEEGLEVPIIEAPDEEVEVFSNQPGEDTTLNINIPPSVAQQLSKAQEELRRQEAEQSQQAEQSPQQAQQAVQPRPMPRPRLSPKVLPGPLMDSNTYAARMGPVAFDAKFSQFGHYLQRMFETIQLQWYSLLKDVTIGQENRPAYVVIEYDLDADGKVVEARVMETNAGQLGTLLCKDAIESRAPFGPWTRQMIDQLGEQQTIRLRFIYM